MSYQVVFSLISPLDTPTQVSIAKLHQAFQGYIYIYCYASKN